MYDPQNGGANREWVEIFNNGASSVDLSGWQFGRSGTGNWTTGFPAGTSLAANQALVITPSAATLDADWGAGINRLQVGSFPSLTDDPNDQVNNATLAIRNASGVTQDTVIYKDGAGWPTTNGNDGNSIYVLPQALTPSGNDSGSNWRPSSQGVYGAFWRGAGGESENHASPGFVATTVQAPFTPSADAAWSMVILPDTQNYVARPSNMHILNGQMDWIIENRDTFKIKVVLQEGDIVNRNSGTAENGVTAVEQWQNAQDAFHQLNGVVPYILVPGNHDFGTTNAQSRDTKFNTYFKQTDNSLVNPATGGILVDTMTDGELQNAYYKFTAPDGRKMLIFGLEYWPRDSVVNWAKGIAAQPQYADYTAVLVTHSFINSGNGLWTISDDEHAMEGGNDGQELWNKLVQPGSNFEMTFNGHIGGDQVGYRVAENAAGVDVHSMLLNSQFETNGGNGWLRVVEFLDDGETVKIRTYSPHFDLYRTNAANSFEITITPLDSVLVWNAGVANFSDGFARGNGSQGVGVFPVNPFTSGKETLLLGNNATASLSGSSISTIASLNVGTDLASIYIAGRNGNATLTVSGSKGLTVSSAAGSGDLTIGEGGYAGTVNWGSSGTLDVQGRLRIGQGGAGTLNQTNGTVVGGNTSGSLKFIGVGIGPGSTGAYNVNNGTFLPGGGIPGSEDRQVIVGDDGGAGGLNIGDGAGGANTAKLETDDDIILGRNAGSIGLMSIKADGQLRMSGNGAPLTIGSGVGGTAAVTQTGGSATIDGELQVGGTAGATGSYTISAGSLTTANDGAGALLIGRSGATGTLRVEGTGSFTHKAEAFVGNLSNSGSVGRLEIIGSAASVKLGLLENAPGGAAGVSETIFWQADAAGVTPLVITGMTAPPTSVLVQLQDPTELAANTGAGATLSGDGMALQLNLAAITTSRTLTLIDNQTSDVVTGFFERGSTLDLYEQGAAITGTGFHGTVTISYTGGTGNDVVLNLTAAVPTGDFNNDQDVDAEDFLAWQRGFGLTSNAMRDQGDANGNSVIDLEDFAVWQNQFGAYPAVSADSHVPEPAAVLIALIAVAPAGTYNRRYERHRKSIENADGTYVYAGYSAIRQACW